MRELRIDRIDRETSRVICKDPDSAEYFAIALDDRFRAAARGELSVDDDPSASVPSAVTGTIRPREIQARIRAGASAQEVALLAGVPVQRITGFALPVLLERSSAADLGRASHPVLPDGPSLQTLEQTVAAEVIKVGLLESAVTWDAWKDTSGQWLVSASWDVGLSTESTHWGFSSDSHGGTTTARNDSARRIVDPSYREQAQPTASQESQLASFRRRREAAVLAHSSPSEIADHEQSDSESASDSAAETAVPQLMNPAPLQSTPPSPPTQKPSHSGESFLLNSPTTGPAPGQKSSRRHPAMPSWEDVLLGVRSANDDRDK